MTAFQVRYYIYYIHVVSQREIQVTTLLRNTNHGQLTEETKDRGLAYTYNATFELNNTKKKRKKHNRKIKETTAPYRYLLYTYGANYTPFIYYGLDAIGSIFSCQLHTAFIISGSLALATTFQHKYVNTDKMN